MAGTEAAVLDIGSSKITAVIGSRGVNDTFNIRGFGESEYDGFNDRQFYSPGSLKTVFGHALHIAETNARTRVDKLYVGLPGDFTDCFVKDVSLSLERKRRVTHEDVEELFRQGKSGFVAGGARSLVACAPVSFVLDDNRRVANPVNELTTRLSGTISYLYADTVLLQMLTNTLRELEIDEIVFIPSVLSEVLYLFEPARRDNHVVLIDAGHLTTDVVLGRGDGILAQKTIQMGGGHITGALYVRFEPPEYAIAEALKRKVVLTLRAGEKDTYEVVYKAQTYRFNAREAGAVVRECIEALGAEIRTALDAFPYTYPDYIPFSLTGGGVSYIRGAKELFGKALGRSIEREAPAVPQLDRPALSSVLGLLDDALEKEEALQIKQGMLARLKKRLSRR